MSHKSEEEQDLKPKDLVFLLAIAGRIDAQSKLLAQKLDKDRYVYHAYAVLDSLSSTYSMFKFFFEVAHSGTNSDLMHDFLTSSEGIATITGEALFLVGFSLIASLHDKKDDASIGKSIANAWPYFRALMKGLKNGYKAWKSTAQLVGLLIGTDLKYLITPVGVLLGIIGAANRIWLCSVTEKRKRQMDKNKSLLLEINEDYAKTTLDYTYYAGKIKHQKEKQRVRAFCAVALSGFLDGLYLYIGVVSLSVFVPPLFIAMTVFSALYTLSCIVSRVYEEYDFQLRLIVSQTKCRFLLASCELRSEYDKLLALKNKIDKTKEDWEEIDALKKNVAKLIQQFECQRQLLNKQTTHSYWTAGFLGMKYGLFAYGVLTSVLFMVSSVFLITATVFPPALLAAIIVSGFVLMLGITAFTLRAHSQHLQKQKRDNELDHPYEQLIEMKRNIEDNSDVSLLSEDDFLRSLKDGQGVNSSPQYFLQERLEIFRSVASGLSKGNNFSNFATTPLQDADPQGHYHDSPVMSMIAMASAVFFAIILGLRALARGLGRPSSNPCAPTPTPELAPALPKAERTAEVVAEKAEPEILENPGKLGPKKQYGSFPRNQSHLLRFSVFGSSPSLHHLSQSQEDINPSHQLDTTQGLG